MTVGALHVSHWGLHPEGGRQYTAVQRLAGFSPDHVPQLRVEADDVDDSDGSADLSR